MKVVRLSSCSSFVDMIFAYVVARKVKNLVHYKKVMQSFCCNMTCLCFASFL